MTRLVLDNKWEREKWEKAWEVREGGGEDVEFALAESKKTRPENQLPRPRKKRKVEADEGGPVWGEPMGEENLLKIDFLTSENTIKGGQHVKQSKIQCLTGVSWSAYEIVREILKSAIQVSEDFEIMRGWEEWGDPPILPSQGESSEELCRTIYELDQQDVEKHPKPQKQVTKTPKNAKKRGRPAKNTQIVGQQPLDAFVVRVRKADVGQAVCRAKADGVVANLPSMGHEYRSIRDIAKEGGSSARAGGAVVANRILMHRSRRDLELFKDEVQPSNETELLGGSTHTSLGHQILSISQ